MTPEERAILEEYARRKTRSTLYETLFPNQLDFINDPSRLKAAQCSRRSGKSYAVGAYLIETCLNHPNVTCIYIALTRESAKRIMYKDILKEQCRKIGITPHFNEITLTVTFDNGSVLYLLGLDVSEKESEKLLGQKYKLAVIDEAASFKQDLRDIVYKKLGPAMADLRGTICLVGTTSNHVTGLFYDVTTGKERGWSLHKWDYKNNPHNHEQVQEQIDQMISTNPLVVETPFFKQMYLNEWVIDPSCLVYKFSDHNLISSKPEGQWKYVLGVDLGYEDDTAFVIVGWREYDKNLYILHTFKKNKMDITSVATRIKYYMTQYEFQRMIIDGSSKQAVEEMRNRHGLPLIATEKKGKADFIEIFNSELIQQHVKLVTDQTLDLVDEWKSLIWDERQRIENPSCPNHLSDATLYAWRYTYSYLTEAITPKQTEEERMDEWMENSLQPKKPFWELDF